MKKQIIVAPGGPGGVPQPAGQLRGHGPMDLALQQEYQEQLRAVQVQCGFQMIRGHGLFSDQMGIYQEWGPPFAEKQQWYCFTYLDRVMDA